MRIKIDGRFDIKYYEESISIESKMISTRKSNKLFSNQTCLLKVF